MDEVRKLCKRLGQKLDNRSISRAFREMDADASGAVDLQEFCMVVACGAKVDGVGSTSKKFVDHFARRLPGQHRDLRFRMLAFRRWRAAQQEGARALQVLLVARASVQVEEGVRVAADAVAQPVALEHGAGAERCRPAGGGSSCAASSTSCTLLSRSRSVSASFHVA